MNSTKNSVSETLVQLFHLDWNAATWAIGITVSVWLIVILVVATGVLFIFRWRAGSFAFHSFEIDQAEIGVGSSKFKFKPNVTDKQVAYAIWVELSTRKIGLPIDLDHDVVVEIYDSWYNFFAVTRDLIKSIQVGQINPKGTHAIVTLSIEVLNEGLRPHLTRWQARFRAWYDRELRRYDAAEDHKSLDPQQLQKMFPQYEELKVDLLRVNDALIRYRSKMGELFLKN